MAQEQSINVKVEVVWIDPVLCRAAIALTVKGADGVEGAEGTGIYLTDPMSDEEMEVLKWGED